MHTYSFEKLDVWQKSREFVKIVYLLTREFPSEEKFGITSQLRRSAISVSSNIAEGCTRWSPNDKARFYEIAYSSLMENLNQLILANDLKYLAKSDLIKLRKSIDEVARMLNALHKSSKKKS